MPVVIAWLMSALESTAGSIIISALLSLGFSVASYSFGVAPLKSMIANQLAGSGGYFLNILGWLRVDVAITMVLSAYAAKWATRSAVSLIKKKG